VGVLENIAAELVAALDAAPGTAPKYVQFYEQILQNIECGEWKPGDRLPPDSEFARELPISLGTIQKAMNMLADDGVIARRHGHGTFVSDMATPEEEIRHFHFITGNDDVHLPVYTRILSVESVQEGGPWSQFLSADEAFVRVTRVAGVNLEFQTYSQVFLSRERFGFILDMPIRELDRAAFNYMLSTRFNAPTLRTVQHFRATEIPADVCAAIEVEAGTLGMHWELYGYTYRDAPISYQHVYVPPAEDRLRIGTPPTPYIYRPSHGPAPRGMV